MGPAPPQLTYGGRGACAALRAAGVVDALWLHAESADVRLCEDGGRPLRGFVVVVKNRRREATTAIQMN